MKITALLITLPEMAVRSHIPEEINNQIGYGIGLILSFLILFYLVYALIKPDKF